MNAELLRNLNDTAYAYLVGDLRSNAVDRLGKGGAQRDWAMIPAAVVLRLPIADLDRPIDHDRLRYVPPLKRGEIHEQLEQRARLALGLRCPVKLAVVIVAAAHHG